MRLNRSNVFCIALGLAAFYSHPNYWRSVWWDKWFFVVVACLSYLASGVARRFHWSAGLLFGALSLSSLWAFGWSTSYAGVDMTSLLAVGKVTSYTLVALLTVVGVLALMRGEDYGDVADVGAALCIADSAYIVGQAIFGLPADERGGFFGNPSISGCFIASTFPLWAFYTNRFVRHAPKYLRTLGWPLFLLPPIATVLTGASQPVGVLLIAVFSFAFVSKRGLFAPRELLIWGAVPIVAGVLLVLTQGSVHEVIQTSGRADLWREIFRWWRAHGHIWTGEGTGISQVLIPMIQKSNLDPHNLPAVKDWWLWLHSDWLQLLFENGVVGLTLGLLMFGYALRAAWEKEAWVFSALVALGVTAVCNFPAHFPFSAFFGAAVLAMSFDRDFAVRDRDQLTFFATIGESHHDEI